MTKRKPSKLPSDLPSIDDLDNALETLAPLSERSKEVIGKRRSAATIRQTGTIEQQDSKIAKQQDSKIAKQQSNTSESKKGVMVYLSADALHRLDTTQVQIKHRFSELAAYDISRSALIEKAVVMMLDDLDLNADSSELIKLLSK